MKMLVALLWNYTCVFQTFVISKSFFKDNWHCVFRRCKHCGLEVLIFRQIMLHNHHTPK